MSGKFIWGLFSGLLPLLATAVDGVLVASGAPNLEDQWMHILPERAPTLAQISSAPTGRYFDLNLIVGKLALDAQNQADVTVKFKFIAPDGKVYYEDKKPVPAVKGPAPTGVMLLSSVKVRICFDPGDPEGKYLIKATLTDNVDQSVCELATQVVHDGVKFDGQPMSGKEVDAFISSYYLNPKPEKLIAAYKGLVLNVLPKMAKEKNFNPTALLYFFVCVLQDNAFLHDKFVEEAAKLDTPLAPQCSAAVCSGVVELKGKLGSSQIPPLFNCHPALNPLHLDMLWSEFFARGTFQPIRLLTDALDIEGEKISLEDFKKLSKPTKDDLQALLRTVTEIAAEWSLGSNARKHKIVFLYLECILKRDTPENPVVAAKLTKILDKIKSPETGGASPAAGK